MGENLYCWLKSVCWAYHLNSDLNDICILWRGPYLLGVDSTWTASSLIYSCGPCGRRSGYFWLLRGCIFNILCSSLYAFKSTITIILQRLTCCSRSAQPSSIFGYRKLKLSVLIFRIEHSRPGMLLLYSRLNDIEL